MTCAATSCTATPINQESLDSLRIKCTITKTAMEQLAKTSNPSITLGLDRDNPLIMIHNNFLTGRLKELLDGPYGATKEITEPVAPCLERGYLDKKALISELRIPEICRIIYSERGVRQLTSNVDGHSLSELKAFLHVGSPKSVKHIILEESEAAVEHLHLSINKVDDQWELTQQFFKQKVES